mmetsp:Transcript_17365/g.26331  ORF Transcript_17365/g.26331 Transcript_17365/m.26331 type:complete len:91 (-) Transcript_17365:234-506(-)
MTYRSRGRSLVEVILAVCFTVFLVGFITVLCIGNYFRAKRAQDRQRQRRLAKLSEQGGGDYDASTAAYMPPSRTTPAGKSNTNYDSEGQP